MEVSYSRNDRIIRRKFYQYLIPTVLMVLAMQFGSLVDAILIGNILGENALSAASLALPIVYLVELPGFCLGVGGAIAAANYIGKRKIKEASQIFKVILLLTFLVSLIFVPIGIFLSGPIATWLSGNFSELQPMMSQYIMVFAIQSPIIGIGLVVSYFLPSDNSPVLGALYFLIGNLVHIGVEVLFVVFLDPSVAMIGAAAATGIGMFAGLVVLIPYVKSKKRAVDLKTPMKGGFSLLGEVIRAGSSTAAFVALSFVLSLVLNIAATSYLIAAEMPVFAMLSNVVFVVDLFIVGVIQVMPSVVPALFGEKDYYGVKAILKRALMITFIITVALIAISLIFPQLYFYIFGVSFEDTREQFSLLSGTRQISDPLTVVRIYAASLLFYAANKFLVGYYPSIMVNSPAVVSNVTRVGLVGPVTIFFLMQAFGVVGYAYGVIIQEGAALLITIAFVFIGKKANRLHGSGLFLLEKEGVNNGYLDISLPAKESEISKAVEELQTFANKISGNEVSSGMLAVACEEIIANIVSYGYKRNQSEPYIDINLTRTDDRMLVRIRDDGVAYDPTSFNPGDDEDFAYHGIEIVRKIATTFTYLRILNTNNTIMEISIA